MKDHFLKSSDSQYAEFYGRNFVVSNDVLTPRPESEQIIDAVLNLAGVPYLPGVRASENVLGGSISILDVGTGSGCLAVTLKLELEKGFLGAVQTSDKQGSERKNFLDVQGVDISEKALVVARENAENLGAEVEFFRSDLLSNIDFVPDVIVANLPYVDRNWEWLDFESLKTDPDIALFAEDEGLELIKKLILEASRREIKFLVLEADPCQHKKIIDFAKNYDLLEIRGFVLVFSFRKRRE